MQVCPSILRLPEAVCLVQDADEEIFDLYTRLQDAHFDNAERTTGLGFLDANISILDVGFSVKGPLDKPPLSPVSRSKGWRKRPANKQQEPVSVSAELVQDTHAHHHRRGDTGSVVWRTSVYFAEFLWHEHLRSTAHAAATLLDMHTVASSVRVLELGSGTGCLPVLCRDLFVHDHSDASGVWLATDQFDNLKITQRNFSRNGIGQNARFKVEELDWLAMEGEWSRARDGALRSPSARSLCTSTSWDIIIAVDCLFNESLVLPLLHTLDHLARVGTTEVDSPTLAIVISELRSPEVLRIFVDEWLKLPDWCVVRIPPESLGQQAGMRLASPTFVMWCGWKT